MDDIQKKRDLCVSLKTQKVIKLKSDRDSWRRVSERIEGENLELKARVMELEGAIVYLLEDVGEGWARDNGFDVLNRKLPVSLLLHDAEVAARNRPPSL